ncbi:MAG: serine/threonine-protein kinase [Acidobacteria bacterium]|nr:serine/threonine-protein kinase [Acidobacteriota bacterium]
MPDTIAHYRVVSKLGEGGMGVVYAAADERLHRQVAIKMVRGTGRDPQSRERLWREARAAASVSHPNVCQLYEVGEANGELFIAMELLEGEALSARLARGPIPLAESVDITIAMLSALGAIHTRGLVHRDLKPSNIFLTAHGVKLLDFGLARAVQEAGDQTHANITMAGTVMGTPHYMSPEQITGDPLDARSDLFAVGAILFELLVGKAAFPGKTAPQVFHSIVYEPLPSLGGSPALAAIDRIVHRATVKRPSERYPDAAIMAQDIRAALRLADSGETPAARTVTRLIVLPFRMLRPDTEIDFLSFSLADAITASLGSLESLVVRSSLAAARFKADTPDLMALASELDVDVAVTGTLLRAGAQVRVATQLVDAQSGRLLWSQTAQVTAHRQARRRQQRGPRACRDCPAARPRAESGPALGPQPDRADRHRWWPRTRRHGEAARPGQPPKHGSGAVCRARLRLPLLRPARPVPASGCARAPSRSVDQDLGDPHALDVA